MVLHTSYSKNLLKAERNVLRSTSEKTGVNKSPIIRRRIHFYSICSHTHFFQLWMTFSCIHKHYGHFSYFSYFSLMTSGPGWEVTIGRSRVSGSGKTSGVGWVCIVEFW